MEGGWTPYTSKPQPLDRNPRSYYPYICKSVEDPKLGDLERAVLVAIVQQHGHGYAVSIADKASGLVGRSVSLGAIYGTTDRLEKKGFISSKLGDPTPERGGKPKRLYQIEAPGVQALSEVRERDGRTWAGISPLGEPA